MPFRHELQTDQKSGHDVGVWAIDRQRVAAAQLERFAKPLSNDALCSMVGWGGTFS